MLFNLLARFLARPRVAAWIIARAQRTPYMHLVNEQGEMYMGRWWLFNPTPPLNDGKGKRWNWLPSIRVHHIMRPDLDRHLHDHPWNCRTFILRGSYVECRGWSLKDSYLRNTGDTARINFGEYHSITDVSAGGVWTMFVMFKYRGTWGFLVDGVKVPWREYFKKDSDAP